MPLPPLEGIIYGPVRSRRLGASLGINLLPSGMKVCNMNCIYCQYGWTRKTRRYDRPNVWPTPGQVEMALAERLERAAARGEIIDRVTIAGHGEPTLHPEFEETIARICDVRDRLSPRIPVAVLSNSSTAHCADVGRALARVDERHMKLDAGDQFTFRTVNGISTSVADLTQSLKALPPIIVQAMFFGDVQRRLGNDTNGCIGAWLRAIEDIRPARVHVYTIARQPALSRLTRVPARRLREIAEKVRAAGILAEVFC